MVERNLLNGVIELHVHPAPDIQPRKFTDMELAEQMKEAQAAAVVLKSHTFPTMARAEIVSRLTGFSVFGSITLNDEVGGFNPAAVEAALNLGAKTVWMPTKSAANHRKYFNLPGGLHALKDGKVDNGLDSILHMIADRDVILSTGHLSFDRSSRACAYQADCLAAEISADIRRLLPALCRLSRFEPFLRGCTQEPDRAWVFGHGIVNGLRKYRPAVLARTDGGVPAVSAGTWRYGGRAEPHDES